MWATTIAQLKAQSTDLDKIGEDTWNGTKVWVVGADKGHTTANQFWIAQKRLLFVRLIKAHPSQKHPSGPPNLLDITFLNCQPAWLAACSDA